MGGQEINPAPEAKGCTHVWLWWLDEHPMMVRIQRMVGSSLLVIVWVPKVIAVGTRAQELDDT